jgi:hypothetical protein
MVAQVRSVDFLPEIFQTPVNTQFLNATLDQLIQEPAYKATQGYVGQKVGPGVQPNDYYVVEPTTSRTNYQLEPGVISLNPLTKEIDDAITYPGMLDALSTQGSITDNASRLFESDYYSWDPFVNLDAFNNYSQYYWMPNGPMLVYVSALSVPTNETFTVTRNNGVYTFSGIAGENPSITLLRNGTYNFVIAQNQADAIDYRVTNNGTSSWAIDYEPNPTLTLVRGNTYSWNLQQAIPFKFYIKTAYSYGTTNLWSEGVTNNGSADGIVSFTVPQDAPDTLYYCNDEQFNLRGQLNIVDADPGTGPGFWIQTQPGVAGVLPWSPNISDRDVLGVSNNGTDLGTVTFTVPSADAQDFYYSMPSLGQVDLIVSNLTFNQINNQVVDVFLANNPTGIDGVTSLNGKTIVFTTQDIDPNTGGWQVESLFDPLLQNPSNNGELGSFDTESFDQSTPVDPDTYYSIWQINYITAPDGAPYMTLTSVQAVPTLNQFSIAAGAQYVNTNWYKNSDGFFTEMPLLTATLDTLFYQDGTDPNIFGTINIIEESQNQTINVLTDIIGKKNYTSPNGVTFTNGLQIVFDGTVIPSSYANCPYFVDGVGEAIQLLPVTNFVTPETYTSYVAQPYDEFPYDSSPYNSSTNNALNPDYITVNRGSSDLNPWTRSNRWFHIDTITAAATYNNTSPAVTSAQRAQRPILEFRSGIKLFNFGTQGLPAVSVIDFIQTDALSVVNGATSYSTDGYTLEQNDLIIFAADANVDVRNQIYRVNFIVPDPLVSTTPVINLVAVSYSPALADQVTVCLDGSTEQGLSYRYNGDTWVSCQQKTSVNQAPLFDVYDANGISFGNKTYYPSSNFEGCKLLSYSENPDNPVDPVLQIPLAFFYLDNIGDIEFTNNLYTDTFVYTPLNAGVTVDVSSGFVREYANRITFTRLLGWQQAVTPSQQRQQFQFTYDGNPLLLDVLTSANDTIPSIQIFINDVYQQPSTYTVQYNTTANTTTITLTGNDYVTGDLIEVLVLSDQVSAQGFYEIPTNLENNPFNTNSSTFTLGGIRNHYATICENLLDFQGTINGPNNTRDLGNIIPYGQQIVQQSAPLTLAGYFLRSAEYNIFSAIEFNSREYIKYKNKLLTAVTSLNISADQTVSSILDQAILTISKNLTSATPFYWSDMLPSGNNYVSTVTTVTYITTQTFNTTQTYNFTESNYLGLLVYVNNVLLVRGVDYVVSTDAPKLTILIPLSIGDTVTINEYSNTAGSYVPNTPTKMGLYPKYLPAIFVDTTYTDPTPVIRGHDGSITIAFNDIRDQVLLEFEKRIYDNIKVDDNPIPLTTEEIDPNFYPAQTTALLPGFFRKTPYTWTETNQILSESFLTWVGQNKLDYTKQDYQTNNPYSWNYSQSGNRINGEVFLQGDWRGIYRYFYDTETPNSTPWQMLGFSEMPSWWEMRYGPAPYTSGNSVLWDDLEAGLVADPIAPYVLIEYARPGLSKIIPASSEGDLLPPTECVVGLTDPTSYQKSWVAGDGGPTEASWWKSSSYPFAIMRLLALTKPAQFFSVFADRDLYRYDTSLGQYLYNGRYRLDANGVQVYGNGTSKASYINWIVDYNRQSGINSTDTLTEELANLDVRLCYRMASFTDAQMLNMFTERAGPSSTNNSLLIPPNSYNILFYKNQPFGSITYSSVVVEQTQLGSGGIGYTVYGYSNVQPYFEIQVSSPAGVYKTITAGDMTVQVPAQYTTTTSQIPYGYTFTNPGSVCDFLLSYGTYLTSQGLVFDNVENGYTLNWDQMAQEFLYFASQGWAAGTLINLNPSATKLTASQPISIVDTVASVTPENMLLNQYRGVLDVKNLVVYREGDLFSITSTTGDTINFLTLQFTNYEDMVVLNNTTQYNDLIYDPSTGSRQYRLFMKAFTTTEWNGQLNAQGFILNLNNVQAWQSYQKYTKGEIVLYKNTYWQALSIVQPQETFNYNEWVKSNYQLINQGLLPNLATKADQLANSYDVHSANLNSDNDLFAFGLIGFRPRQYMSNMDLDITSQIQLYQQFLGTKGTLQAAELFKNANLGKESGDYQIYENWAILAGTYGAQANRSFIELILNESLLKYNPSTVQIINPGTTSYADQTIFVNDLWKESYKITSPDILPVTYEGTGTSTGLPTAGYVCLNDVDITVFDIKDPTTLSKDIDSIGIGTYIWIAKINPYNWGVYRANKVDAQLTQITNNLNNSSLATFDGAHNLKVGDLIIIKYFNSSVNGVYRVLTTPSLTTITIAYNFTNANQTTVTGTGLVLHLQSARVDQANDITSLAYVNNLIPGSKVWVDKNADGLWEVLEKQTPFASSTLLTTNAAYTDKFGTSIAQSINNSVALIGAPGTNDNAGQIYGYNRGTIQDYDLANEFSLTTPYTAGYGQSVSIGNQNWGVAGAPFSLSNVGYVTPLARSNGNFTPTQLLVAPDQNFTGAKFGTSVVISKDEQWMYVGAPGTNTVYSFERVDVQSQAISYPTDGVQYRFNYADYIQIDPTKPKQLTVNVSGFSTVYGVDYTLSSTEVIFYTPPNPNLVLYLSRTEDTRLDYYTYTRVQQNTTTGSGSAALFTVTNARGTYYVDLVSGGINYSIGNTLTINYTQICPTGSSANNLVITVTGVTGGAITSFTYTGSGINNTKSFVLGDYFYTVDNIWSFVVKVDDVLQRPYYDYTFNTGTKTLTFTDPSNPSSSANITVLTTTYWDYVDAITVSGLTAGDLFGNSISTTTDGRQIIVGAPETTINGLTQAGCMYIIDRSVFRYQVTNTSTTTYAIPQPATGPISVQVNGVYLLSTDQSLSGQYTISGNNVVFTDINFTIGDNIDIGTNQFQLLQKIVSSTPSGGAKYGTSLDSCPLNCSVYTGAPFDSTYLLEAGSVDHNVNQSRVYGITTSTIANPVLTAGDTLRINNIQVTVPDAPNNTIEGLISAINSAGIPNAIATATTNLEFIGDGVTKSYDIGTLYSAASQYTTVVYINNTLQTSGVDYTYDSSTQQINFVTAPILYSEILVVSGRMVLSVKNSQAADPYEMLTILPGTVGSAFNDIGIDTFITTQQILSPAPSPYAFFGQSLSIDTSAVNLMVGAPNGNVYEPTTFDAGETYFDEHSTTFYNPINNGGVAYTYDYFNGNNSSAQNPGQFAFGQQIYSDNIVFDDQYGTAVNYTNGKLIVGATGGINNGVSDNGYAAIFNNPTNTPAWYPIRIQQPVVNVEQLNAVYSYDRSLNSTQTYFDFFDPLQGKILGVARQNINYIGAVDPASYNNGTVHNNGNSWSKEHVGEMWWDTDTVRFIDPNQDDIVYASRRWGSTFPGSRVDIYQWIESTVPPSAYTGPGTPLSVTSYTIGSQLGQNNIFQTFYYYWVRNVTSIATGSGKTLSSAAVASYITDPRSSGLPYIAALNASTIAVYNAKNLLSAQNTILNIGFDRQLNDAVIHQEYQLIQSGVASSFLNPNLYKKFQDSLCGIDLLGNAVPDPTLSPGERYGVQFRPRQSMFVDRFSALKNYLTRANTVLAQYPISETRSFNLLNSSQPIPAANSGAWDFEVANLEILSYQNLDTVPVGYRYLVLSDSSQNGRWTIYQVEENATLLLVQVQSYVTSDYWYYINWYLPGYNSTIAPLAAVSNYAGLSTLSLDTVPVGSSARVLNNGAGKFEIYLRTGSVVGTDWKRVGLEDGTIAFKDTLWDYVAGNFGFDGQVFDAQYFDEEPVVETRYIIQALNEEIYIEDLLYERNSSLILMFSYAYSESTTIDWLSMTSLVDISHNLRALQPYQTYLPDNQTFVTDYFQEVKPYHVQVREYNLIYNGEDNFLGDVSDYDLPAFYNTSLEVPQFTSPILQNSTEGEPYTVAVTPTYSTASDFTPEAQIWLYPSIYSEWYNNYLLSLQGVTVINGGSGYTIAPTVLVNGVAAKGWKAIINGSGRVTAVVVGEILSGYLNTVAITLVGGNGHGAVAVAQMGNSLVRSIKTIMKYDRYQYSTNIVPWVANVIYPNGTQVRYDNAVWEANNPTGSSVTGAVFDTAEWSFIQAADLSGVNRTMGYYVPATNQPGLSLPLLIDGIDYPGVQVQGVGFDQSTGFDVGNFDITPFDNFFIGPEGQPTYSPSLLDTIYSSSYADTYLGTRPTDINVDGGAYVDTYSSHAPEELVPGATFDTLDFRVYTNAGGNWTVGGHGYPLDLTRYTFDGNAPTISFAGQEPYPASIAVVNQTTSTMLSLNINYTVDWTNQTVTILPLTGTNNGDVLEFYVYELGGGNQLYKNVYNGADVGNSVTVPVAYSLISEFAVFVNGTQTTDFTYNAIDNGTILHFGTTYTNADFLLIVAYGTTTINNTTTIDYSWSAPVVQYIETTSGQYTYSLDNNLAFTNPVNAVVNYNGLRLRTAAGAQYIGNGTTTVYSVPDRLASPASAEYAFQLSLISDDIAVYLDQLLISQSEYTLEPFTGNTRTIRFNTAPSAGSNICVVVLKNSQAIIDPVTSELTIVAGQGVVPSNGSIISVTTWNDLRQQNMATKVFVGPTQRGVNQSEGYSSTTFDHGNVTNEPGSFDYANPDIVVVYENNLRLGRIVTDASRLWVTLDGKRLNPSVDFQINNSVDSNYLLYGTELVLASGLLQVGDVVMVTMCTDIVAPEEMEFRIFQDMRGVQLTYRMTPATTTTVSQDASATDDIIYVDNASNLTIPNFIDNVWGIITINGERIMYREIDLEANTISSLLRGTAGTGAADHSVGSIVYDLNVDNLLYPRYQNYLVNDTILADGSTTNFITNFDADSTLTVSRGNTTTTIAGDSAIEVYVGGYLQTTGYAITDYAPVTVEFTDAPPAGANVTVVVRRGVTWYQQGVDSASDGIPLQLTNTPAARFLRGL